ncbi:MAG: hypothetical protein MRJ92_05135 [Nitrospira sp.]|nr:hypothetical protein [Nitrospira sp.]
MDRLRLEPFGGSEGFVAVREHGGGQVVDLQNGLVVRPAPPGRAQMDLGALILIVVVPKMSWANRLKSSVSTIKSW